MTLTTMHTHARKMMMRTMANTCQSLGENILNIIASWRAYGFFVWQVIKHGARPPYYGGVLCRQLMDIGHHSIPMVAMTALFTGMVLALQSYVGFARTGSQDAVAQVVVISITRELAPVLTGLMMAGKVGAFLASEIGSMRSSDQIDALQVFGIHPLKFLIAPRLIATVVVSPLLVFMADVLGVWAGYMIAVHKLHLNSGLYIHNTWRFMTQSDVWSGLVKALAFGACIGVCGCYSGYSAQKSARDVGLCTTRAVVSSSLMILVCNYILTLLFFK